MTLQKTKPTALPDTQEAGQPESIERWATEAPLRLVAWALGSKLSKGSSKNIREKLEGRLGQDTKWKTWWDRVLPAVKDSRDFFNYQNPNSITLRTGVLEVPAKPWDSLPPVAKAKVPKKESPKAADWRKWFLSEVAEPSPGLRPTKPAFNAVGKLPAKNLTLALDRSIWGAREFLRSDSVTPQPAAAWLELVSRAFTRFRDLNGPDAALALALDVGELLTSLAAVTGYSWDSVELLLSAGALPGEPHPWQRQFVAGMWPCFQQSGGSASQWLASQWLDGSLGHDRRSGRAAMARQLVAAALSSKDPTRLHSELDRILDRLFMDERLQLIHDLMVRSAAGEAPKEATLAYVVHSRHRVRADRLSKASGFVSDGVHPVVRRERSDD